MVQHEQNLNQHGTTKTSTTSTRKESKAEAKLHKSGPPNRANSAGVSAKTSQRPEQKARAKPHKSRPPHRANSAGVCANGCHKHEQVVITFTNDTGEQRVP